MDCEGGSFGDGGGSPGKEGAIGKVNVDDKVVDSAAHSGTMGVDGREQDESAGDSGRTSSSGGKKRQMSSDEDTDEAKKPNKLKDKRTDVILLISHALQGRFRRATWVLSRIDHHLDTKVEGTITDEDEGGDITMAEEEDDEPAGRQLQRLSEVNVADALAILGNRDYNVVAVMGSNFSAFIMEYDPNGPLVAASVEGLESTEVNREESSNVVVTKNPIREADVVKEPEDWNGFWKGPTGIRLRDARAAATETQPDGRVTFTSHINVILRYVDAIEKAPVVSVDVLIQGFDIYILRTCLVKIANRMEYHCLALGALAKTSAPSTATYNLPSIVPSKFEKPPVVDYASFLLPKNALPELATFSAYRDVAEYQNRFLNILFAGRTRQALRTSYTRAIVVSEQENSVLSWIKDAFHITALDLTHPSPPEAQEAFGILIVLFLSGCASVCRVLEAKKEESKRLKKWLSEDPSNWDPNFRSGMARTAISGRQLESLLIPGGFLERHIFHIFENELHAVGCLKWLRRITSHFYAISVLIQPTVRRQLASCELVVLETRVLASDSDMEDLASFIERVDSNGTLTDLDKARLVKYLRPKSAFRGSTHCEATLLLLCIIAKDTHYARILPDDLVEVFRSINPKFVGVSKGSCPTCASVITLAEEVFGFSISHSGSHSTYTACALPPWTPTPIAERLTVRLEADCLTALRRCANQLAPKDNYSKGSQSPETRPFFPVSSRTGVQTALWNTTEWNPELSGPEQVISPLVKEDSGSEEVVAGEKTEEIPFRH